MKRTLTCVSILCAGMMVACNRGADIDKLPAGSEVNVTRADGGVVHGNLVRADADAVVLTSRGEEETVARRDIADVRVVPAGAAGTARDDAALPPSARFRDVHVPAGTELSVALDTSVASDVSHSGDPIRATLRDPILIDGASAVPAGAIVSGVVSSAQPSGKVSGRASLSLTFDRLEVAGGDAPYAIEATFSRTAAATKGEDAKKIGVPAVGGAILGGIFGGKKGAVIGGAVGGGAGTAVVLSTSGDEVRVPRGTALTLHLDHAVSVHVPLRR